MKVNKISYTTTTINANQVAYVVQNDNSVTVVNNGDDVVVFGLFTIGIGSSLTFGGDQSKVDYTVNITFAGVGIAPQIQILKEVKTLL